VTHWVRFRHQDATGFGTISGSEISVHDGEMFGNSSANGQRLALSAVELMAPSEPSKIIALWNNFHALAAKLNVREPDEPLYLDDGHGAECSRKATDLLSWKGRLRRRTRHRYRAHM
jgi:uncharacterized protein DUF2437